MIRIKNILSLLLIAGAVLYAVWPLFGVRFIPTHDGEYHIIRFSEFYNELAAGHWFPRWASNLNSGYGLPLFIFHYPLPNYIGSLFHFLGASFVDSVKLTLAAGYISAVIFCFVWLINRFSWRASTVGTIVFATVPYWFVDIYVRGSVGEVLAIAFVMLSFLCLEYNWRNVLTLSLAGIALSHNISAMIFFPVLFGFAFFRKRFWITSWIGAVGLSAYFWIPALLESKYMVGLNTINFREHFPDVLQLFLPSWGTGFSQIGVPYGEMSQQIGVVPIVTIVMAGMGGWLLLLIFFLLPYSRFAWELVRPLHLVQFPWRLLALVIPLAGYSAAIVSSQRGRWVGVAISIFAVLFSLTYMRPVTYEPRGDNHYLTRKEFTDGTSSLGNSFSTIWTGWKRERLAVKKTLYFPGWTAWVDGKPMQVREKEGVIDIPLVHEGSSVVFAFSETPVRFVADMLSVAALFWLAGSSILKAYAHRYRQTSA